MNAVEQLVGPERREREFIADFQLPIVDLIRAARSTVTFGGCICNLKEAVFTLRNIAAFLILIAPICSAQTRRDTAKDIDKYFGQATDPLRMAIKPAKPLFSRHEPFVFVVTFTNTSEGPVFLNVGSLFSFRAYLTTIKKDPLYVTTYAMSFSPKGTSGPPRQEDYKEIPRGKSFSVKVTSQEVVMVSPAQYAGINHPSWDERKPGRLKFFLKYFSGRYFSGRSDNAFFARQLEGSMNSNEIILYVK